MKLPDWRDRLFEVVCAAHSKRFEFARHDCVMFVADCVLAQTGIDYAEEFRGTYESMIGANHIISRAGSLDQLITKILNREPIPAVEAQRGDVVFGVPPEFKITDGSVGVCLAPHRFCFVKELGVVMLNRSVIRYAWRIE